LDFDLTGLHAKCNIAVVQGYLVQAALPIADQLSKASWFGLRLGPWILAGKQSGLLTRIATTERFR
jgi:hypothetical protein